MRPHDPKLETTTHQGREFSPCYTIDDWGFIGWFIGTDYRCSSIGTHGIGMPEDYRITKEFSAEVLWPDKEVRNTIITLLDSETITISDHGNQYPVTSPVYGARATANGVSVNVMATELLFDLSTITSLPSSAK